LYALQKFLQKREVSQTDLYPDGWLQKKGLWRICHCDREIGQRQDWGARTEIQKGLPSSRKGGGQIEKDQKQMQCIAKHARAKMSLLF